MLQIKGATEKLQLVTSVAGAIDVSVDFAVWDLATGAPTIDSPSSQVTAITTQGTTDILAVAGANLSRRVKRLVARNKASTGSNTVTLQRVTAGPVTTEDVEVVLPAGSSLVVNELGTPSVIAPTSVLGVGGFYDAQADFGFVGDLVTVFDGACSTAANTKITSATAAFTTNAKVGQRITLAGAGASGAQYTGTIAAIDSATQVDVSPAISTTVSAKGLSFGTDNGAAITLMQNTVNNATFPGARILFGRSPTNAFGFPARVVFNKPAQIEGIGGGHTADTGDYTRIGGTRLAWWGTDSDSGVNYSAFFEFSPSGVQSLKRVAFRSCWLDCRNGDQNEALFGLKLNSCHGFMLNDFFIMDALAVGLITNVDADPTEAKDTTRWSIKNFCVRELDNPQAGAMTTPILMTSAVTLSATPQSLTVAANTLPAAGYCWVASNMGYPVLVRYTGGGGTTTLTGCVVSAEEAINAPATVNGSNVVQAVPSNAACTLFDGATTANTCCALMEMSQLSHGATWGPAAMEYRNADSIECQQIMINGGNATADGAINRTRKPGVRFCGSNSSDTLAARNNVFKGGSAGAGGVFVAGVLNTGSRMSAMPGPNYWSLYQMGNGEPIPVVEGSAFFDWQPNGGFGYGQRGSGSVADQAISAATLTLITGSLIQVPPQGFQVGAKFRWKLRCSKTAAGVAARNFFIRIGTAGTTADGIVAQFTSGTPTGAVDRADIEIEMTIRTLGASATATAHQTLNHDLDATGFVNKAGEVIAGSMSAFNSTTAKQFIGLSLTTGASEAITVQSCGVECINPANP
jgi:hypothetical protein